MRLQVSFWFVPLVNPVDHAEQSEGCSSRGDRSLSLAASLHFCHQAFYEVYVFLLASIDPAPQRGRQRMVFVQHDGDLAIARTQYDLDMQPDQRPKTFLRIRDTAHRIYNALLREVHGVVHDLEENFVFALKVVVEATLTEFESPGYIIHGGGVVTALLKKARRRPQDFLTGIHQCFSGHRVSC